MFRKVAIAVVSTLAISSSSAFADFSAGMFAAQLEVEAKAQAKAGKSPADIARAGIAAGVNARFLTTAMLLAGISPSAAISGLVSAGGDLDQIVGAAFAAGVLEATIVDAATAGGASGVNVNTALALARGTISRGTLLTSTPNAAGTPGGGSQASPN